MPNYSLIRFTHKDFLFHICPHSGKPDSSISEIKIPSANWRTGVICYAERGGLGSMIYMATSRGSHVDQLYAVLLLIIFIGFVQDKLLKLLDKKLFKFKYA